MDKKATPFVSVIMPVYNSEKYVGRAIESVLKQTFRDFELIIVDDGSTDSSGSICDNFANSDKRIIVIHKKNGGVCSARNVAMEKSSGKYVTFIDNDDIYEENFLEILIKNIVESNADLVKAGIKNIKVTSDLEVLRESVCTYKTKKTMSLREFSEIYFKIRESGIISPIWNGLYCLSLIKETGLQFNEEMRHGNEDLMFNSMFLIRCHTISIIPDVLYNHFYRLGHSTSTKFYADQVSTRLDSVEHELLLVGKHKVQRELLVLESIRACFRMLLPLKNADERKPYIKEIEERLDFSVLKNYQIIKSKDLSRVAKLDIFLIKNGMYQLYFGLRKFRLKIERLLY